jgi:hypothetical protein
MAVNARTSAISACSASTVSCSMSASSVLSVIAALNSSLAPPVLDAALLDEELLEELLPAAEPSVASVRLLRSSRVPAALWASIHATMD